MASSDAKGKGPLQASFVNPTPQTSMTDAPTHRSDPLTGSVSRGTSNNDPSPCSTSNSRKPHQTLKLVALILAVYLGLGTVCFYLLEPQMTGHKTNEIIDAVYFCIVTMATVGYGDIVPNSVLSKLIVCVFAFAGMALVALGLTKAVDYFMKKQVDLLINALRTDQDASEAKYEKNYKGVKYKCLVVIIIILMLMIAGTAVLATVEKLDLIDAFYCVSVTITTLGYGDKSFKTERGRIFAVFWILTSTIFVAQFLCYITELHVQRGQRELVQQVLSQKITNKDLEAADLDKDKSVELAEFIVDRLKMMEKISKDDIADITEEFRKRDVNKSNTLTESDLPQSSQAEK